MPRRWTVLATGECYHVFNRSVGSADLFHSKTTIARALDLLDYYRFPQRLKFSNFKTMSQKKRHDYLIEIANGEKPYVEVYAFALMPDHFHLLLRQRRDKGIQKYLGDFQNGFAKYFNVKNDRHGSLFQNPFKAVRVKSDAQFLHVSRYIHLNPVTAYLIEFDDLSSSDWTSFSAYAKVGRKPYRLFPETAKAGSFLQTAFLTKLSAPRGRYVKFVADQVDYQRTLKRIQRLTLEKIPIF